MAGLLLHRHLVLFISQLVAWGWTALVNAQLQAKRVRFRWLLESAAQAVAVLVENTMLSIHVVGVILRKHAEAQSGHTLVRNAALKPEVAGLSNL